MVQWEVARNKNAIFKVKNGDNGDHVELRSLYFVASGNCKGEPRVPHV